MFVLKEYNIKDIVNKYYILYVMLYDTNGEYRGVHLATDPLDGDVLIVLLVASVVVASEDSEVKHLLKLFFSAK